MPVFTGHSNWDYVKVLAGPRFRPGMSSQQMWYLIVGGTARPDDSINDLLRKWNGNKATDGYSNWDWLRLKLGALFHVGDSENDMLRKFATAYPNGYP